ncbi:MAG: hypothetical protein ACRCX2_10145 [Paraclostridium sp.]
MSKTQLLDKWRKELNDMYAQKQAFIQTDRFKFAREIENLDNDISLFEDVIYDLEYEILNDSNIINEIKGRHFI